MCPRPQAKDFPLITSPAMQVMLDAGARWTDVKTLSKTPCDIRIVGCTVDGSPVGATSIHDCYMCTNTDKRKPDKLYYTYNKDPAGRYDGFNRRGDDQQAAPNDAATEDGAAPPGPVFSAGKGRGSSLGARASVSLVCAATLVAAAAVAAAA